MPSSQLLEIVPEVEAYACITVYKRIMHKKHAETGYVRIQKVQATGHWTWTRDTYKD